MISSRQIESLRVATRELTHSPRPDISGTLSLAALPFETSTDHDAEALYEFIVTLERAILNTIKALEEEEDD